MKQNVIIATIIGAIVSFLLGWLVWGVLTMDYYNSNMSPTFTSLQKNPPVLWIIFIAQIVWSFLIAYSIDRSGATGFMAGLKTGAIIFLLVETGFVLMFHATMDIYANHTIMVFDIILNTIFGGIVGGVVGWWLGRSAQPSA